MIDDLKVAYKDSKPTETETAMLPGPTGEDTNTNNANCKAWTEYSGSQKDEEKKKQGAVPSEGVEMGASANEDMLLWEEELAVREQVSNSSFFLGAFFVNTYAALYIVVVYLISLESLLSISLSVGLTVYTYNQTQNNASFDGSVMDWVLLSFAVITPMSASIGFAFNRRDQSLQHLAVVKTTLWNIYSAHACWNWASATKPGSGRDGCDIDWTKHGDKVLMTILLLCQDLARMLTLPNSSRARHRVTSTGAKEANKIMDIRLKLHRSIYRRVNQLTSLCEIFKLQGLPPNEATRVRQWERLVTERIEQLEMIKKYRTPQALRSFARLFSVLLPPFYAPYYGQMATDLNSLGAGIAFSVLTCIALTSLFESISQMEDPFVGLYVLDGIHVNKELGEHLRAELLECRKHHFPNAGPFRFEMKSRRISQAQTVRLFQAAEI